jgi:hypothetical protein
VSADVELIAGHAWPQAPHVFDHIAAVRGCSDLEARLELQREMQNSRVKARGPGVSSQIASIASEFWRYSLPEHDGTAFNLSTLVTLPWFEVCAADVLAIWPHEIEEAAEQEAPPKAVASEPEPSSRPPFNRNEAMALLASKKIGKWREPPTEAESRQFLLLNFRGVPNDPHRAIRRELWPNKIRRGPRRRGATAN